MLVTKHSDNKVYGITSVIIKHNIKHYEQENYQYKHMQATSINVEELSGPLTVSAVYCPPMHKNKKTTI